MAIGISALGMFLAGRGASDLAARFNQSTIQP